MRRLALAAFSAVATFGLATGLPMMASADIPPPVVEAEDPFLWLEEVKGERALAYVAERNAESMGLLQGDPRYPALLDSVTNILTAEDRIPYGSVRGGYVYNLWQDTTHVRGIWRRATIESYAGADTQWETLIDVDALAAAENENWVWAGADCAAPDFNRCLISLSRAGGDAAVVREYDIAARGFVDGGFHVEEAKTTVAWFNVDTLLIGSNFGEGSQTTSGYPRITKMWKRGTPLSAAETIFEGQAEDTGIWPGVSDREEGSVAYVTRAINFFDTEYHIIKIDGSLALLPVPVFAEWQDIFEGFAIFKLRLDWAQGGRTWKQGSLISMDMAKWLVDGGEPVFELMYEPTDATAVDGVSASKSAVWVALLDNVKGRVLTYTHGDAGWVATPVAMPENGTIEISDTNAFDDTVFINYEDFLTPDSLYMSRDLGAPATIKSVPARFDATGLEISQLTANSKDGTAIPYFVVRKPGAAPGPTLLYAYGGFQVSMNPWYWATAGKLWLERGGAVVVANIRGGGEFGPRWHEAARGHNRQKAFDDFIAVAEALIATGITTPAQLGISGGSNGGLLVGVAFTQRPDLFNAVLCDVPLLDMIRYTQLPPGASWIAEYGDPAIPEDRAVIETYSPYQNVDAGRTYPKVLFLTSTEDDRVHPGHARKMSALMLSMGKTVLFYEETEGGHSAAANLAQRAKQLAMQYVYLSQQLGLQ